MSDTTSPTPQVSTASSWKQSSGAGAPLSVPSGNVCLVRPVAMQTLIRLNMIPNDLMDIITGAMSSKKGPSRADLEKDLTGDRLVTVLDAMDAIVQYVVVDPKIASVPVAKVNDDGEEIEPAPPREPDVLYIDEIDYEDKTFIFQWAVGGTRDLSKFRRGFADYLGDVAQESGLAQETQ